MKWVKEHLRGNESIILKGEVTWHVYLPLLGLALVCAGLLMMEPIPSLYLGTLQSFIVVIVTPLILVPLFILNFKRRSVQAYVTSHNRLIIKHQLMSNDALDLHLCQSHKIMLHQGILGRGLNFGDIVVRQPDGKKITISNLKAPHDFLEACRVACG